MWELGIPEVSELLRGELHDHVSEGSHLAREAFAGPKGLREFPE